MKSGCYSQIGETGIGRHTVPWSICYNFCLYVSTEHLLKWQSMLSLVAFWQRASFFWTKGATPTPPWFQLLLLCVFWTMYKVKACWLHFPTEKRLWLDATAILGNIWVGAHLTVQSFLFGPLSFFSVERARHTVQLVRRSGWSTANVFLYYYAQPMSYYYAQPMDSICGECTRVWKRTIAEVWIHITMALVPPSFLST